MLYISFGIILLYFILNSRINERLDLLFGAPTVNIVSKVGYCSYSIYIIHFLVNFTADKIYENLDIPYNQYIDFFMAGSFSIIIGMMMTYFIEDYFLGIRNRYFPNRA